MINNILLIVSLLIGAAMTTKAEESKPQKPCSTHEYRHFDFWIGEWEVFDPSDKKVGENKIESILGGCVLQENWVSESPNRGHSFNIYDQTTGKWHQTWVDNGGTLLQLDGGSIDGKMVLQGETKGQAGMTLNRITWSQEKANVRQVWDISQNSGESWKTIFNGLYKPKKK